MTPDQRRQAIDLYDRFTHEGMDRRDFMAAMTRLVGSAAAASAFVMSVSACAKGPQPTPERIGAGMIELALADGRPAYQVYAAPPPKPQASLGTVMVIHENRGLNPHIRDVARRLAAAGFHAFAPDFLSPAGGTPADEDQARTMIGKLDLGRATADAVAMLDAMRVRGKGAKVGAVGFCWGGAFVNRLAIAAGDKLSAGVAYYGPAPDPAEAARVRSPLLLHYAGLDTRVNATGAPWVAALEAAGKDITSYTYPGVNHAFNNDTSAERYDKAAADLAWGRTLAFLRENLA